MELLCLPITPNHVRLIIACYPAAPLAAAPDYRPNSQELSRLTYYASNRPGKLHKVSNELEKRAKNQARRAQTGHAKAKALLLVTLDILRALTAECRRDLSLFSDSVIACVQTALACLPADLDVVARAASLFTAWSTYTDGTLVGVDDNLSKAYLEVLSKFATLSIYEDSHGDTDIRNRTRLVGLAALSSAIQSDALFNSNYFVHQVSTIVPALLHTLQHAGLSLLGAEATAVDTYTGTMSPSPYISDFQPQRPVAQRKARSIHIHIDGEKGPSFSDVVNATLRALHALLSHSNAIQVPEVLEAAFKSFDSVPEELGWANTELCCWLVAKITDWTQYQYRYALPTRLLERLLDARDTPQPKPLHFALVAMITTIFTSPTPLINLSTTDILSNLVNVIVARLVVDPEDPLIPSLVECITSLGTHIYYADQIQDLAEELISRLVAIQANGLLGRGRMRDEKGREEGMRCLIACLRGLLLVADRSHQEATRNSHAVLDVAPSDRALTSAAAKQDEADASPHRRGQLGRRNRVAPEVWQDTVALLCEAEYAVRNDYSRTLVQFLQQEVVREPFALGASQASDVTSISSAKSKENEGRQRFANVRPERLLPSDPTLRFLHALHASAFTLAVTPSLGLNSTAPSTSSHASSTSRLVPLTTINVIAPTPADTPRNEDLPEINNTVQQAMDSPEQLADSSRLSSGNINRRSSPSAMGRSRAMSVGLSLVDLPPPTLSQAAPSPATPSDYSHLSRIFTSLHENLPARSLLAGVPVLISLDNAARWRDSATDDPVTLQRQRAIEELVLSTWRTLARVWECAPLENILHNTFSRMDANSVLPPISPQNEALFHLPEEATTFQASLPHHIGEAIRVDAAEAIECLAASPYVQQATGLSEVELIQRLGAPWSVSTAIKDSIEKPVYNDHPRDGTTPFLKISPAFMHIDNKSLASIARTTRGVGVGDLREALEGRGSMSNTALASTAQSLHTDMDHQRSGFDSNLKALALARTPTGGTAKVRKSSKTKPGEVRDVLNKLGIGKQNGSSMLHAPLPTGTRRTVSGDSPAILIPPYK